MKLSIIIPVYNVECFLEKCLRSIIEQTKDEVEIILVDDGSTDNSWSICTSFAGKYNCIKAVHKPNGGVSSARNLGLSKATGDYIAWVDADDYVSDDWYSSIKDILDKDYDLIYFDHFRVCGKHSLRRTFGSMSREVTTSDFIKYLCDTEKIQSYLVDKIFKREIIQKYSFPLGISFMEDYSIMHKIVFDCKKIYYISKILYNYRIIDTSLCRKVTITQREIAVKFAKDRYNWVITNGINISKFCYLFHEMLLCVDCYRRPLVRRNEALELAERSISDTNILELAFMKCKYITRLKFILVKCRLLKPIIELREFFR